jgi:tRNA 2-selenouridine synthase
VESYTADRVSPADFLQKFRDDLLIDVRTPHEFSQGHIPGALNVPIFSDAERAEIGLLYKKAGSQKAVLLGLKIIEGRLSQFAAELIERCKNARMVTVYCWRGGMRSSSVLWLLNTLSLNAVRIEGGYKGFRTYWRSLFAKKWKCCLLSGKTGSGKTRVIQEFEKIGGQVVDLEFLAGHRGSAFGGLGLSFQPSQEQFENLLGLRLHDTDLGLPILIEDENRTIGRLAIPHEFWLTMKKAPIALLETPIDERVKSLSKLYGEKGNRPGLIEGFQKIEKRLGSERTIQAIARLKTGDIKQACILALEYYDKAYTYQLEQRIDCSLQTFRSKDPSLLTQLNSFMESINENTPDSI